MDTPEIIALLNTKPGRETAHLARHVLLARGEGVARTGRNRRSSSDSHPPTDIPGATARLASDNTYERERAGEELRRADGDISPAREPVFVLHQSEPQNWLLISLLAKMRDTRVTALLIAESRKPMGEYERANVLEALGDTHDPSAVDTLIGFLDHRDAPVRKSAAEGLGKIGDPRTVKPIRARLLIDSVHKKIRNAWKRQQRGKTVGEDFFESLTRKASVQIALAAALVRLGAPDAQTEMLHCLPYEDGQQTYHGVSPLPGLALLGESVVPALIDVLRNDDNPFALVMASYALAQSGQASTAVDALLPLLSYTDTHKIMEASVRGAAACALGTAGDKRATIPLCELLADERWMVDYQVRDALVSIADPVAAPFLARSLTTGKGGWSYNARALTALLLCGREAAFPPLAARLASETDAGERVALLFALAWLNDKRALPILHEIPFPPSNHAGREVLTLAVAYLEAAPDDWLAPQWEA